MLAHLRDYELLQFIEKPVTLSNPTLTQQDQLLLAWLFSAITPFVLPQIAACMTSFDVWTTLEGIFYARSKTRVIQLQNQIRSLRKDTLSVDEYFAKLTEYSDQLRQVGVIIDDGELSLIALNGLDETYDPFVNVQMARINDISFVSMLGCLCSFDARLSRHNGFKGVSTTNTIQTGSSTSMIFQICSKRGHDALACFYRHNEQRFSSKNDRARSRYHGMKSLKPGLEFSHQNPIGQLDTRVGEIG